jgi:hypothetical protein
MNNCTGLISNNYPTHETSQSLYNPTKNGISGTLNV